MSWRKMEWGGIGEKGQELTREHELSWERML